MRVYEELFILKPDTVEEEVDGFVEQIQHVITTGKGTVDKTDKWGVRKLAYRVQKYSEGLYVLIQFSSTPDLVKEVERRMRVADQVIKFITVRIDEKQKKIEKRKKARDKRAARRPAPQPMAAPAIPAAAAPAMPALPAEPAHATPGHAGPGAPPVAAPESTEVKE
ncbi:MAG: 30S ribosomal protein S6 [Acidobacteriota bacterium]|nr:30S ribosomal protein S6 [Acidobacteriota bacterium]